MKIAALTFVYNEHVNLPIWRRYYGQQLGEKNLFIIDRESDDGSTTNLGEANRIVVPRDPFDDVKKVTCMSSFQSGLLAYYDAVICGDCDEIVVPDPSKYSGLVDYVARMERLYATCVGIDVLHIITEEPPLDTTRPILAQRRFGRFRSVGCKTLLSRVPILWAPGLHSSNKPPKIDQDLVNFHLKVMDYQTATLRQKINQDTEWSAESLAKNLGAHHRYDLGRFVRQAFLETATAIAQQKVGPFEFEADIAEYMSHIEERGGIYYTPNNMARLVEIPSSFSEVF
jgi:hypothetical protein